MPRLTITQGPLSGQRFSFTDAVVVGRGTYCEIRLDDSTVSRRHAQILREDDGRWRVRDLGSANGTFCDGMPLQGDAEISADAELVFGEVAARLEIHDPVSTQGNAAPAFPHLVGRLELLAAVTTLTAGRDEPAKLIDLALDTIVRGFEGCDHATLLVVRPGATLLTPFAQRSRSGAGSPTASLELAQGCLRHVDGIVGNADTLRTFGFKRPPACALAMPVVLAGEMLGALIAESTQADTWNPLDQSLGKALASAFAVLLDHERANQPERRVAERDLLLARRVQQHFLPATLPSLPGYHIAETYAPARAVGGDHYDLFRYADDRVGMIIADVSGKAVSAALVMARIGMAVRLIASQAGGPLDLLVALNVLMVEELEPGMFATAQVLALTPADGSLQIANAGHPSPFLRGADGSVAEFSLQPGAPLGADARTTFPMRSATLEPGACLLLYSDGLSEAENMSGEQFELERVKAAIAGNGDARTLLEGLNRALTRFVGGAAPADDLTLLAISRDASV